MNESVETTTVGMCMENGAGPVPLAVPGELLVRLGEGWSGSLHDLVDGLAEFELGAEAAVEMFLTWMTFVEIELKGFDDLVEGLRRLRGAVMVAGVAAGLTLLVTCSRGERRRTILALGGPSGLGFDRDARARRRGGRGGHRGG